MRATATTAILTFAMMVLGWSCAEQRTTDTRPVVVVSVVPQATFVTRIAGERVKVVVMIPPGAGELYEPTMADMQAAAEARLYVKVGHPAFAFERAWLDRLIGPKTMVVDGSAGMSKREGDPHVWVSPAQVRVMARNIEEALAEIMPEERTVFEANLAAFEQEIDTLDTDIRTMLAPCKGKAFFVFHPAWGYFAEEYGLVQIAVEEEGKEPSAAAMAETIEAARAAGAKAVFVQPQFPTRSAQMVADEIGATVIQADPLAADWSSNLREVSRRLAEVLAR